MATDAGARQPDAPRPDWSLPQLVSLEIRRTRYEPPRLRTFRSRSARSDDAVEFLVETNHPFPARALSPVLYVGETAVTEGETIEGTRHRFVALDPNRLEVGATITLGWPGQPTRTRRESGYRYEPPKADVRVYE